MTIIITNCTNRKRKSVPRAQHISELEQAPLSDLAIAWGRRLEASLERFPAKEIYGGRTFQEASAAAKAVKGRLLVISAGLGLIEACTAVPPYACTVLIGASDSVSGRVSGPYSITAWWRALSAVSPFARPLKEMIFHDLGPILVSLSDAYLAMLADELLELPTAVQTRVRIFTRTPIERVAPGLRAYVMPYDDRLDGPDSSLRGTRSDFAARALRHFVGLGRRASIEEDVAMVKAALADWSLPMKHDRIRHDDATLLNLIRTHWTGMGGSSSKLLRFFRDDLGVACEQSRFAALARQVRGEKP